MNRQLSAFFHTHKGVQQLIARSQVIDIAKKHEHRNDFLEGVSRAGPLQMCNEFVDSEFRITQS